MANQGAAGTRITLVDDSRVEIVDNPNAIGGVVGYSTRGEFNKIHRLGSTPSIDTVLGSGYNNSKYNQGLYAARALVLGGGNVEYVRPLVEENIKTDAYVVSFDSATSDITTSFSVAKDIAGSDTFIGDRTINDIATTIVSRSNIDFSLEVDTTGTSTPLFAIMNSDPTASTGYRSEDADDIANDHLSVTVAKYVDLEAHDTVDSKITIDLIDDASVALLTDGDTLLLKSVNKSTEATIEFAAMNPSNGNIWVDISTPTVLAVGPLLEAAINSASLEWTVTVATNLLTLKATDGATIVLGESSIDWFVFTTTTGTTIISDALIVVETVQANIVMNDAIGRSFLGLGLATEMYVDATGSGNVSNRKYILNEDGVSVAKLYIVVDYNFAGELYSFEGTVIPFAFGESNLYIGNSAEFVENGFKFIVNTSDDLDAVAETTLNLGQLTSATYTQASYEATVTAWEYAPKNNNSSAMYQAAWNLFLDKDTSRSDYLIAAGTAVKNLFKKNLETIDFSVMAAMLNICELRKDMFAIFDGVAYQDIEKTVKAMIGLGGNGEIDRWGAIFDGRSIFEDVYYTKLNVEVVKSVELANIITNNRRSGLYWLPPAGQETGRIPAAFSKRPKFERSFNYAADEDSDIALLYNINVNPTRNNDSGQYIYGQKTMLKRDTALNRLNVVMLIAGIHKTFEKFLDTKVFSLNTADLRANITSTLQLKLDGIKSSNPAGLTAGLVICDSTNNTSYIIDTNQLIVDVRIQPTRAVEFITLRTTVQRTGDSLTVGSQIL